MTEDNPTSTGRTERETDATQHPYRLDGVPPLPFDEDDGRDRGDRVWAVIDLGRVNEDPAVDRVFHDEDAARHHKARIEAETSLPVVVQPTRLE